MTNTNTKVIEANVAMYNKKVNMEAEKYLQDNEVTAAEMKMYELKDNEAFVKKLAGANNAEDVQKIFAAEDVTLTAEEANAFAEELKQTGGKLVNATEELTEDELETITGGTFLDGVKNFFKKAGAVLVGMVVGAVLGAVAGPGGVIAGIVIGGILGGAIEQILKPHDPFGPMIAGGNN